MTALGRAVKEQGHQVEVLLPRYDFFLNSPILRDQMRYETEFDWGGTRVFVSTAIVENVRVFFIEPRNGFFATPTVYGRYVIMRGLPAPTTADVSGWVLRSCLYTMDTHAHVQTHTSCISTAEDTPPHLVLGSQSRSLHVLYILFLR